MKPTKTQVIVLGGGKAGKSLAIDLGKQGIETVLIERSAET
jgi:2-polyprenyl-6-methoxyphenol hydroxylase-like FAD-dependent oxidoreductase